ncbi:anti-sigma-K factor RskA [Saccharothrix ecbatanensis]|uniref:Regulator of SigK n=1 Tax=Saccharothrix ecbatanensis TaxID=1105145 RepID=A0A7W9HHK4_9PSEU|nr:anti-sigma factor [Saccharothrix ecbatanensis]MBB5802058.1 anti-sigma-K factor RskA [Saccharothrix ecbatanensis]
MTDNTARSEAHTLIGAYALDAVSEAERRLFEEHLAVCSDCAQELAELRETTALLAGASTVEPPAHLRDRVLAAVADTRRLPPETGGGATFIGTKTGSRPDERPAVTGPKLWLRRTAALAAAAGIAVAVTLGIQGVDTNRRLERDLHALQQANAQNSRVAELLSAPDAKLVRGEVAGGGTGTVVASSTEGAVVFLAQGLARLPEDRAYQMWLIGPDGPRSAGLLTASDDRIEPLLAGGFTGKEAVGLTVEPQGGSPQPTTPTVVVLPLV